MQIINYTKEALKTLRTKDASQKFHFSSLKLLIPYVKAHRSKIIFGALLMIVLSLLAMPSPLLMRYLIDEVFLAKNMKMLNLMVLLLLSIQLARLIFSFLNSYVFNILNQEIMVSLKKDLFHKILRLPLSFFDKHQTGYIFSRIGEVGGVSFFFSSSLIRLLIGAFEVLFSLVILFHLHWKLTFLSLSILPLFYFAGRFYSRGLRSTSKEMMEKGALLSRQTQESLLGVNVVKMFTAEEKETEKIHFHLDDVKRTSIKNNLISVFSSEILSLIGAIGGFVVLWYSGFQIIEGNFTLGGYIAFTGYLAKIYGPTLNLATTGLSLQPAITALNRISEFFKLTGEDEDKERTVDISGIKDKIEFKKVSFSYEGGKEVLKDISFTINKGEKVFIRGPNGAGKSTIVKLIIGLYKNTSGKIYIDNQNINKITLSSLRERGLVLSHRISFFLTTPC